MICPRCRKDIQPERFPTGLQELIAFRVHYAQAHRQRVDMNDALEIRAQMERAGVQGETLLIRLTDEIEEKYL